MDNHEQTSPNKPTRTKKGQEVVRLTRAVGFVDGSLELATVLVDTVTRAVRVLSSHTVESPRGAPLRTLRFLPPSFSPFDLLCGDASGFVSLLSDSRQVDHHQLDSPSTSFAVHVRGNRRDGDVLCFLPHQSSLWRRSLAEVGSKTLTLLKTSSGHTPASKPATATDSLLAQCAQCLETAPLLVRQPQLEWVLPSITALPRHECSKNWQWHVHCMVSVPVCWRGEEASAAETLLFSVTATQRTSNEVVPDCTVIRDRNLQSLRVGSSKSMVLFFQGCHLIAALRTPCAFSAIVALSCSNEQLSEEESDLTRPSKRRRIEREEEKETEGLQSRVVCAGRDGLLYALQVNAHSLNFITVGHSDTPITHLVPLALATRTLLFVTGDFAGWHMYEWTQASLVRVHTEKEASWVNHLAVETVGVEMAVVVAALQQTTQTRLLRINQQTLHVERKK